jgi:hypothetical protein
MMPDGLLLPPQIVLLLVAGPSDYITPDCGCQKANRLCRFTDAGRGSTLTPPGPSGTSSKPLEIFVLFPFSLAEDPADECRRRAC